MNFIDIAGLVVVQAIWGFHVTISKIGMHDFPPLLMMGMRFAIVAAVICPFWRLPRRQMLQVFGLSLTFGSLNYGLFFSGVNHLDASTATIVGQAQVPFSAMLAAYFYNDRFGWRRLLGLTLSFLGLVLVVGQPRIGDNFIWVAAILAACLLASFGNVQIKALGPISSFTLTGWMALFTAPQLLAASFLLENGQWHSLRHAGWHGWSALAYTVFVVAIGSYLVWYPMLRRFPLNQVMPYTLLTPVFGVLSGVLMLGESLTLQLLLGGAATIGGVAIIVLRQPQAAAAEPVPAEGQPPRRPPVPVSEDQQGEPDHVV